MDQWGMTDGDFEIEDFYDTILQAFEDAGESSKWYKETLGWWNQYVFNSLHANHSDFTPTSCSKVFGASATANVSSDGSGVTRRSRDRREAARQEFIRLRNEEAAAAETNNGALAASAT